MDDIYSNERTDTHTESVRIARAGPGGIDHIVIWLTPEQVAKDGGIDQAVAQQFIDATRQ